MTTSNASAQAVSGSFNPQTQFPKGSTVTITSVYGLAVVPSHPFNASSMPGPGNRNGNQTNPNHNWNQTGGFSNMNQTVRNHMNQNQTQPINHNWNQTFNNPNRNGTFTPPVTTYSASITVSGSSSKRDRQRRNTMDNSKGHDRYQRKHVHHNRRQRRNEQPRPTGHQHHSNRLQRKYTQMAAYKDSQP